LSEKFNYFKVVGSYQVGKLLSNVVNYQVVKLMLKQLTVEVYCTKFYFVTTSSSLYDVLFEKRMFFL